MGRFNHRLFDQVMSGISAGLLRTKEMNRKEMRIESSIIFPWLREVTARFHKYKYFSAKIGTVVRLMEASNIEKFELILKFPDLQKVADKSAFQKELSSMEHGIT